MKFGVFLAAVLFAIGIFLPMITITELMVFSNSFSIVSGIYELLKSGHIVLFVLISGFSVVLPVLKIGTLHKVISNLGAVTPKIRRYLHLMHAYGRWAMLDVMVVAVLIVTVKLGTIASIKIHFGLYVFGAAVLLIMFITQRVVYLTNKL